MSQAWKGPVVLLREPVSATAGRLGRRLLIAAALTVGAVAAHWTWLMILAAVFAVIEWIFAAFAVINTLRNRRVLLVHQGSGTIEWPRSIQEVLLRRPTEFVAGHEIEVTYPPVAAMPGAADPRITLTDGEHTIKNVPLYGVKPEDFVASANALLVGRATVLTYVESEPEPQEEDDSQ